MHDYAYILQVEFLTVLVTRIWWLGSRSEIPPVKYAQIQGSNFGRKFHENSWNLSEIPTRKWVCAIFVILRYSMLFLLNFDVFLCFPLKIQ